MTASAPAMTTIHDVTMNGVPFDLSNDVELAMLLQTLLKNSLEERPETLEYALYRTKALLRAYVLVSELERIGLLRGT